MCQDCKTNGPQSIVGVATASYAERLARGQRFRMRVCYELQGKLLWGLWKHNKTPEDRICTDHTLSMQLWRECDLNFQYQEGLAKALRARFMEKAKALLKEADAWGAFQSVGSGKERRLLWKSSIVAKHFASPAKAIAWVEKNRDMVKKEIDRERRAAKMKKRLEEQDQQNEEGVESRRGTSGRSISRTTMSRGRSRGPR